MGASMVVAALVMPSAAAAGSDDKAVLSPLGMSIANAPVPVLAADGRNHLAYEITIVNQAASAVTIDRVQPRAHGRRFGPALQGSALAGLLRVNGAEGPEIPAGGSALLFMDLTYGRSAPAPRRVSHGFAATLRDPAGSRPLQRIEFVGVPTRVARRPAIAVRAPLRGSDWLAAEGCCDPISAHRGATLSIDGTVRVPERFAIDFVQLGENLSIFDGPLDALSSYKYFGTPVHSVAAGRVVRTQDGRPEETPGTPPSAPTVQTAGGNYVVVRLRRGQYAFYAHMQPGSLTVARGDRVRSGQVLGRLGNTGNADAPHLHFHVMDGPSPLQANGLPFVFRDFRGQGKVTNPAVLAAPTPMPAEIDRDLDSGRFRDRMPLSYAVIAFGK